MVCKPGPPLLCQKMLEGHLCFLLTSFHTKYGSLGYLLVIQYLVGNQLTVVTLQRIYFLKMLISMTTGNIHALGKTKGDCRRWWHGRVSGMSKPGDLSHGSHGVFLKCRGSPVITMAVSIPLFGLLQCRFLGLLPPEILGKPPSVFNKKWIDGSEKRDERASNSLCNAGFYLALNHHFCTTTLRFACWIAMALTSRAARLRFSEKMFKSTRSTWRGVRWKFIARGSKGSIIILIYVILCNICCNIL